MPYDFRRIFGNGDAPEPNERDGREFCRWLFRKNTDNFQWWAFEDTEADLERYVAAYTAHFLDNGSGKNPIKLRLQGMVTWYLLWSRKTEADREKLIFQDELREEIYEILDGWVHGKNKPRGRADQGLQQGTPEAKFAKKCMELSMFVFGTYHDPKLRYSLTQYEEWIMDPSKAPSEFRGEVTWEVESFFTNFEDSSRLSPWAHAALACKVGLQQPGGSTIYRIFNSKKAYRHLRPATGPGKLAGIAFASQYICAGGMRSVAIIRDNTVPFDDYYIAGSAEDSYMYLACYSLLKSILGIAVAFLFIVTYEKARTWILNRFRAVMMVATTLVWR